ncbi:MAG TPA: heavy metal-associated domain-containing protein [Clostridiales bacterium]|nr:heavy metal-associated domain-containing protein [Clostridiales bacterium]
MTNKTYQLQTLTCPSCMAKIQGALRKTAGVKEAEVLFNTSRAKVSFNEDQVSSDTIKKTIESLGFKILGEK